MTHGYVTRARMLRTSDLRERLRTVADVWVRATAACVAQHAGVWVGAGHWGVGWAAALHSIARIG